MDPNSQNTQNQRPEGSDGRDLREENGASYSPIQAALQTGAISPPGTGDASSSNRSGNATRIRRRNRMITSCLECRRRKLKCDKQAPCTNCTRQNRPCLYLSPAKDAHAQQKLADIKDRMGAIEQDLERTVAKKGKVIEPTTSSKPRAKADTDTAGDSEDFSDDEVLEPTPLATRDLVYEDNVDDELMDLGVQLGKMRVTERIGGWSRPKFVEELTETLKDVSSGKPGWAMSPRNADNCNIRQSNLHGSRLQASPKSYIGPGPEYIGPSSSFFFPGVDGNADLMDYLPTKDAADKLISQYWTAVHYMCRTVHRPTFEAQYLLFWAQISVGNQPASPVQALVFAAMFSAAASMTNEQVIQQFGTSKMSLVDSLRNGTELALAKGSFLRTTKLDTLQAFVMYLIPLGRAELSKAHSALIAAAVRLAECIGLHRDGTLYNMTPVQVHVRRMIWHQLCFLDMRSCEASGPRPQIRKEDYDTKMPLNVDDVDLLDLQNPPTEDKPTWTDMTFSRIRAECGEMRRKTWSDVLLVDGRKKSLTSLLVKVQKFLDAFEAKFLPMLDTSIPFQHLASLICKLLASSFHVQALHRYLFSTVQRMPDRLRQVLIEAILGQLESTMAFESLPELQPWVWYRGAFFQYHSALLLMIEVYAFPMRKEAARIWKCLDFIFEIPSHLAPKHKAELVITDLRDRMEVYHQMRKLRSSNHIEQLYGDVHGHPSSYLRRPGIGPNDVIDSDGNMRTGQTVGGPGPVTGLDFSPPSIQTDSDFSGSHQGSSDGAAVQVSMMEDIDWAEWDKVFDPQINNGDLNLPDFNMADFTGEYDGHLMNSATAETSNADSFLGLRASHPADLSDVHFSPSLFPTPDYMNPNRAS